MRARDWHSAIRRYILAVAGLHLIWELAQLPLYAIWREGSAREIAIAVAHCLAGDVLIALSTLVCALLTIGSSDWPARHFRRVAVFAVALGWVYTAFSEHVNTARGAWRYSDLMPVVPGVNVGLSPLLQWLVVPCIGLWWAARRNVSP